MITNRLLLCSLGFILLHGCSFHVQFGQEFENAPAVTEPDKPVTAGPAEELQAEKKNKAPKTIFEWAIGEKADKKENGKERDKDEKQQTGANNEKDNDNGKENANGKEGEEEKRLDTDRPHFPESSNTVGNGRAILEAGYTFTVEGSSFRSHSYPETLLRVGMFADWFELRIAQNFISQRAPQELATAAGAGVQGAQPRSAHSGGGAIVSETGAQDLTLGVKLGLSEQKKYLPESALILQVNVPTGSSPFTTDEVSPGVNYDFSWEVVKEKFSLEGVISANGARDDVGHSYVSLASGLSAIYNLTRNLEAFYEWYAFYPAGAVGSLTVAQHYSGGGFVYYLNNNVLIDIRAEAGLNQHAHDFLVGSGFAIRY